jgi:hypothetical protein
MTELTYVLDQHMYGVHVLMEDDLRTAVVDITLDRQFHWTSDVSPWRGVSFGAAGSVGYLWSARELILLPRASDTELSILRVDEDLLACFWVDGDWLLVCETSVRRLVSGKETDRIELGEVVDLVRWQREALWVRDAGGREMTLRVNGARLET